MRAIIITLQLSVFFFPFLISYAAQLSLVILLTETTETTGTFVLTEG